MTNYLVLKLNVFFDNQTKLRNQKRQFNKHIIYSGVITAAIVCTHFFFHFGVKNPHIGFLNYGWCFCKPMVGCNSI